MAHIDKHSQVAAVVEHDIWPIALGVCHFPGERLLSTVPVVSQGHTLPAEDGYTFADECCGDIVLCGVDVAG